jgi:hypothetical protein
MDSSLPWLKSKPYLVAPTKVDELTQSLEGLGFRLISAKLPSGVSDVEETLLVELTRELKFAASGAGSWAAYNDRLWDLQVGEDDTPVAILISGLDRLIFSDLHSLLRCIHNLLSMTEAVGLSDGRADLQIEYFFVGSWDVPQR